MLGRRYNQIAYPRRGAILRVSDEHSSFCRAGANHAYQHKFIIREYLVHSPQVQRRGNFFRSCPGIGFLMGLLLVLAA